MKKLILHIIISIVLFSCNQEKPKLKLLHSTNEPEGQITKVIKKVLEKNLDVEVELIIGKGSIANLDSLSAGSADLTIVENNMPFKEDVRTVLPIYEQVLHIFYRSDKKVTSFPELVKGKKVYIGEKGSASYRFMKDLFVYFRVDQNDFTITDNPFDNDVFCGFSGIISDVLFLQSIENEGFLLYSFDDIQKYGKGSIAEGISLVHPQLKPFVIPQGAYGTITKEPVLTIGTDAVLIVREDVFDDDVYAIAKTIFRDKQEFNEISPLINQTLDENFNRGRINYPLHNGARIFLDRDEPSFAERYAELGGVAFSILVAITSGLVSLSRWQRQKKKDRVDVFYKDLIDIKNSIPAIRSIKDGQIKLRRMQDSQNHAFQLLIDEKLEANESFRIYMELSKETITELKLRLRRLKTNDSKSVGNKNATSSRDYVALR